MSMLEEFKNFAMKGNVVDLAIGVIIGGAFGKIVDSIVQDIIMPLVGKVLGGAGFFQLLLGTQRASCWAVTGRGQKSRRRSGLW